MPSVIFDFDSTLISVESLEKILFEPLRHNPELLSRIEAITAMGMSGEIGFAESLSRRLALAAPTLSQVTEFGQTAAQYLTTGMADLIANLLDKNVDVRVVSGGLVEAIVPLAATLGILPERVHAVRLTWQPTGEFGGIDLNDPFSHNKLDGFQKIAHRLPKPIVVIGDGMTDFQLASSGLANHFIAYCEHVQRQAVIQAAETTVGSVEELRKELEKWL